MRRAQGVAVNLSLEKRGRARGQRLHERCRARDTCLHLTMGSVTSRGAGAWFTQRNAVLTKQCGPGQTGLSAAEPAPVLDSVSRKRRYCRRLHFFTITRWMRPSERWPYLRAGVVP